MDTGNLIMIAWLLVGAYGSLLIMERWRRNAYRDLDAFAFGDRFDYCRAECARIEELHQVAFNPKTRFISLEVAIAMRRYVLHEMCDWVTWSKRLQVEYEAFKARR